MTWTGKVKVFQCQFTSETHWHVKDGCGQWKCVFMQSSPGQRLASVERRPQRWPTSGSSHSPRRTPHPKTCAAASAPASWALQTSNTTLSIFITPQQTPRISGIHIYFDLTKYFRSWHIQKIVHSLWICPWSYKISPIQKSHFKIVKNVKKKCFKSSQLRTLPWRKMRFQYCMHFFLVSFLWKNFIQVWNDMKE